MRGKADAEAMRKDLATQLASIRGSHAFLSQFRRELALESGVTPANLEHYDRQIAAEAEAVSKLERELAALDRVILRWERIPGLPQDNQEEAAPAAPVKA